MSYHELYRLSSGTYYFIHFITHHNIMQTMEIFYSFLGYNEAHFLWLLPPAGGKTDSRYLKCFVFQKIGSVGRQHSSDNQGTSFLSLVSTTRQVLIQ